MNIGVKLLNLRKIQVFVQDITSLNEKYAPISRKLPRPKNPFFYSLFNLK